MAEHRGGVAQAEVAQVVAIGVGQRRTAGVHDLQCLRCAPIGHPVKRHAEQQMLRGAVGQLPRLPVALHEHVPFMARQGFGAGPVNAFARIHAHTSRCSRSHELMTRL